MTNFKRFILGIICGVLLACFVIGGLFLLFGRGNANNQSVLDSNLISLNNRKKGNETGDNVVDKTDSFGFGDIADEALDDEFSILDDKENESLARNSSEMDALNSSNKSGKENSSSNDRNGVNSSDGNNGNYREDDNITIREAGDASWKEIIEKEAEQRDAKRMQLEKLEAEKKSK